MVQPGGRAFVDKAARARIGVHSVGLTGEAAGAAKHVQPFVGTFDVYTWGIFHVKGHVVGNVQVQEAIAVQIAKGRAGAPVLIRHPSHLRPFGESLPIIVAIEPVGA